MTLEEILERIENVLYQGVDTESQDLDLLRHDIENHLIELEKDKSEIETNRHPGDPYDTGLPWYPV